ncbi:coenzyme F420-0:L-glutamate ligase [Mesotoga sp. UBA5557]|uniref:coenzyme F420-0:L-glutamate ligase n=1 Tax=Mesotoga sp. UBA5557 TaxID=1946857 RepID=UPI0025E50FB7|nr:coenzyme F420-0:L-glutamate ligase [Mesotoga sp. UBA5557]
MDSTVLETVVTKVKDGMSAITVTPVRLISRLEPGKEYPSPGSFILRSVESAGEVIESGDVIVITSKIVSILEGRCYELSQIRPSLRARLLGKLFGKQSSKVELILREGRILAVFPCKSVLKNKVIRKRMQQVSVDQSKSEKVIDSFRNVFMIRKYGVYLDEAGIDASNLPKGWVSLLPKDPCESAEKIRQEIELLTGKKAAVIITDTIASVGKTGSLDVSIGFSGIDPLSREHARTDLFGKPKSGGMDIVVDSIAAFAGTAMGGFDECSPICIVRGLNYRYTEIKYDFDSITYPASVTIKSFIKMIIPNLILLLALLISVPFGRNNQT